MPPIVEFRHVTCNIGTRTILRDINLTVERGETLVLLGRSGSGKTTLLRMVNALVKPTSGEVLFDGIATTEWDPIQLRRKIGYVIQEVGLFPHYTVRENVALVPKLEKQPDSQIDSRVRTLLTDVGLAPDDFADRYPRQLSGGQRQRVGIARALAADPPLMLLDEPFGALDPITRLEMQRQFIDIRNHTGKSAIFVTHDIREAMAVGTKIVLLREGSVDTIAPADEFRDATSPEAAAFLACLEPPVPEPSDHT